MEPKFKIAFCGGGNLAHASIATIGHYNPDYTIDLLTTRPNVWTKTITAYTAKSDWESRGNLVGKINNISSDPKDIVPGADIIMICSPAHTKIGILKQIKPYLKEGALIGSIFGQGGFDFQCQSVLGSDIQTKDFTIFSLQYVPFICKAVNYGKDVNIIGPKRTLYATAFPADSVHYVSNVLSQIYFMPCLPVPNFMNLTLCPSNQIIHPGRVTGFFMQYPNKANQVFKLKDVPLLYEGLDQQSADEIQGLDDEIQAIKKAILKQYPQMDLSQVLPLKERVESMYKGQISDNSSLKRVFNTNIGYSRVPFPMIPVEGQDLKAIAPGDVQVRLNHNARFFWEDMPFGLVILKDIGEIVGVPTPNTTRNLIFHQEYMPIKYVDEKGNFIRSALVNTGAPSSMGITTIEQLLKSSLSAKPKKNNIFFAKL